jgi:glycosyltransferase involved in cell wall biosynthesis
MRVALVTFRYAPHLGGIEHHVRELAEGLARRDFEVDVLTQERDNELPRVSQNGRLTVRRFHAPVPLPRYTVSPRLMRHLVTRLGRYDVVHAHNYHEFVPLMAALGRPTRLVVTPHYHPPSGGTAARVLRWPHRALGGPALRRADRVICVSEAEAVALRKEVRGVSERLTVIPCGVDVAAIRRSAPWATTRPVVLSVGRLVSYKRVDLVVRAVSLLKHPVDLVIVGDGPEAGRLRELAAAVGVAAHFVGRASDDDLHRWLRTASVVATMSQREAFGLTLLEAFAAEARVVVSDIPAHRDTARYGPEGSAYLVPVDAAPNLVAAAIDRAVSTEPPNRSHARIPTWDDMAQGVADVYRSLQKEVPRPRRHGR